jgi:hypothetical protein
MLGFFILGSDVHRGYFYFREAFIGAVRMSAEQYD